jgi:hypothetical protein
VKVSGDRLTHILSLLTKDGVADQGAQRLVTMAAEVTGVSGAGIMLMSGDVARGSVAVSDDVADAIEALQYTLGEGPCVDAYRQDRPVLEPDLRVPQTVRWTAFAPAAVAAGVAAIFGFPLRTGSVRLGALNLYRDRAGPLSDDQYADALVAAEVVCRALLTMQAGAPPGSVSTEIERDADFGFVVHQAAGMVSVQLGVSVAEALTRLRAYAFVHDERLAEVGAAVVDLRLRFTPESEA